MQQEFKIGVSLGSCIARAEISSVSTKEANVEYYVFQLCNFQSGVSRVIRTRNCFGFDLQLLRLI